MSTLHIHVQYKSTCTFHTHTQSHMLGPGPVTMTSPAVCLGPLRGFGRGWGGMLKKPGEAKHTVPLWGWRLEVREEGGGCCSPPHHTALFLSSSQPAETPCVSAKQWTIASVYFTYSAFPPAVSPHHPSFPIVSIVFFILFFKCCLCCGWCRGRPSGARGN